jgi:hypothetical protein
MKQGICPLHEFLQSLGRMRSDVFAIHHVGSIGNTSNSSRPQRDKWLTYVLNDAND